MRLAWYVIGFFLLVAATLLTCAQPPPPVVTMDPMVITARR